MKKIIEIKVIDLDPSVNYWDYSNYPDPGVYEIKQDPDNYYFVNNGTVTALMKISVPVESIKEEEKQEDQSNNGYVTLPDILKVIAVSQKPELAKELLYE